MFSSGAWVPLRRKQLVIGLGLTREAKGKGGQGGARGPHPFGGNQIGEASKEDGEIAGWEGET